MALSEPDMKATNLVLEALRNQGLEPRLVDPGRVNELRGGLRCFNLRAGWGVDAAILFFRAEVSMFPPGVSGRLYNIEYAVRGTIRGVLQGKILLRTTQELRGIIKKRLVGLKWEVPSALHRETKKHLASRERGTPPSPSELWEKGPHQALVEKLNCDTALIDSLKTFRIVGQEIPPNISIYSDNWGESVRIRADPWSSLENISISFVSPIYLEIVNKIGEHLKDVRRNFGGLTF